MINETSSVVTILEQVRNHGVKLWVENGKLKFKAKEVFPDILKTKVIQHKHELIELLSNNPITTHKSEEVISEFPLPQMQSDIVDAVSLTDKKHLYNVPITLHYYGDFCLKKFEHALESIIQKHKILNAKIDKKGSSYHLSILDKKPCFEYLNYESQQESFDKNSVLRKVSNYQFDIESGPLYFVSVIKVSKSEYYISFVFHHLVFDGVSIGILLDEFNKAYYEDGSILNKNDYSYFDFIDWYSLQRDIYMDRENHFWKKQLANLSKINLPYDFVDDGLKNFSGSKLKFSLKRSLSKTLSNIITNELKITPFNFFMAIYVLLMRDFCNQDYITIGITTTLRKKYEFMDIVGMFVNSLPMSVVIDSENSVSTFIKTISKQVKDIFNNNLITTSELKLLMGENKKNLFDTMFLYEEVQDSETEFFDGKIQHAPVPDSGLAKFSLTLSVLKIRNDRFDLEVEYNNNLFAKGTIKRLLDGFIELLKQFEKPEVKYKPLKCLHAVTTKEKRKVIEDYNNISFSSDKKSIVSAFKEQVCKNPSSIAVVGCSGSMTYAELDLLSSCFAKWLINNCGDGPGIVALCMNRDIYSLAAIIAIFKAGYCYVPIDPEYPEDRIEYILKDSQAVCIIVDNNASTRLSTKNYSSFNVENYFSNLQKNDITYSAPAIDCSKLSDPAYIIYTSGSTGKPKGVVVKHSSLTHYIQWSVRHYIRGKGCGTLVHSSLSFDLTVTSLFSAIYCGKTTYMVHDDSGIEGLLRALEERQNYSLIKITPAHLRIMQQHLSPDVLSKISTCFVIGGEALYLEHLNFLMKYCHESIFVNEYGPTETTVGAMNFTFDSKTKKIPSAVPIGRPIGNYKIYILDYLMRPVPLGTIGEIYISGIGLAQGYLNNENLNSERFIKNPFKQNSSTELMYKTGDLAKLSADGILQYIGRVDEQVKINGYRIELGEIENVLKDIIGVQDAVAIIDEKNENKQIIAYLVFDSEDYNLSFNDIKEQLVNKLPFYMRPSDYRVVSLIPLTTNAKIDKKTLRKLPYQELKFANSLQNDDLSPIGDALLQLWRECFDNQDIAAHDDFLSLGGDSLMAIQLVSKMRDLGCKVSTRDLYKLQNIYEIDRFLKNFDAPSDKECADTLNGKIPLTPIQKWFFNQKLQNQDRYLQVLPIRLNKKFLKIDMKSILNKLFDNIDVSKIRFSLDSENVIQFYADSPIQECYYYTDINTDISQVQNSLIEDAYQKIKVFDSPLIHVIRFKSDNNDTLLFIMHHLIIDAYSWSILKEKLASILNDEEINLSASYKCWSNTLNRYLSTSALSVNENIETKDTVKLRDIFSNEAIINSVTTCEFGFSIPMLQDELKNRIRRLNINMGDVLLAALYKSMLPYTVGLNGVPLTIESYGRADIDPQYDFTKTVGWFTCFYPLSIPHSYETLNILSLLKAISGLRSAIPDLGVRNMNDSYNDLPPICFNYLGDITGSSTFNGLMEELPMDSLPNPIAKENHSNNNAFLFELNCWDEADSFKLALKFKKHLVSKTETEQFVCSFKQEITNFIDALIDCPEREFNKVVDVTFYTNKFLEKVNSGSVKKVYRALPGQETMLAQYKTNPESQGFRSKAYWTVGKDISPVEIENIWRSLRSELSGLNVNLVEQDGFYYQLESIPREMDFFKYERECLYSAKDALSYIDELFPRQFNLSRESLIRCITLQYLDCSIIMLDHHHALLDGESIQIIKNVFDDSILSASLPGKNIYKFNGNKSYYKAINPYLKNEDSRFWDEYLTNYSGMGNLPLCKSRQTLKKPVDNEGMVDCELNNDLVSSIKDKAKNLKISASVIFELAWGLFLSEKCNQSDISFGVISSGRARLKNSKSYVGMFMNIVPVRIRFADLELDQQAAILQNDMHDIVQHDSISLNELERKLALSDNELINTVYSFENEQNGQNKIKFSTITNSPLSLLVKWGNNPALVLLYDEDIFDRSTVELFLSDYLSTLHSFSGNNYKPVKISSSKIVNSSCSDNFIKIFGDLNSGLEPLVLVHGSLCGYEVFGSLVNKLKRPIIALDSYNLNQAIYDRPLITDLNELADLYLSFIKKHSKVKKFSIAGFSLGGLISLAMLNKCKNWNFDINRLFMIDSFFLNDTQKSQWKKLHNYFISEVSERTKLQEFYEIGDDQLRKLAKAELQALMDFSPPPMDDSRIYLFKGSNSYSTKIDIYKDYINSLSNLADNGWLQVYDKINITNIEASHFTILNEKADELAMNINKLLEC
ncbi:MAG: amino acid adenylation domain-containing protein [Legionellales bacterium]|nr:amino acid adenylation domain-containing protein [Legionellales bacterium]